MKLKRRALVFLTALCLLLTACAPAVPAPESSALPQSSAEPPPRWPDPTQSRELPGYEGELYPYTGHPQWSGDSQTMSFLYHDRLITLDRDNQLVGNQELGDMREGYELFDWNDRYFVVFGSSGNGDETRFVREGEDWKLVNAAFYTREGELVREQPRVRFYGENANGTLEPIDQYTQQNVYEIRWVDDTHFAACTGLQLFLYDVETDEAVLVEDLTDVFLEHRTDNFWPDCGIIGVGAWDGTYYYSVNSSPEPTLYTSGLWAVSPADPVPRQLVGDRLYQGYFLRGGWIFPYKDYSEELPKDGVQPVWVSGYETWRMEAGADPDDVQSRVEEMGEIINSQPWCGDGLLLYAVLLRDERQVRLVCLDLQTGEEHTYDPMKQTENPATFDLYWPTSVCRKGDGLVWNYSSHYSEIRYDLGSKRKVEDWVAVQYRYDDTTGELTARAMNSYLDAVSPDGSRAVEFNPASSLRVIPLD